MLTTWPVTLPDLTGDEPRKAYLYLPDQWRRDHSLRFPVLYMFDGHNLFDDEEATYGKSWGLSEYLDYVDAPLIVAAVECNHGPNHERLVEYCPFTADMPGVGRIRGRGKATMDWFVRDFKPYVDANFPTLPDREHTFIGGSSMGGLMSLYAVTAYNQYFSRCAALSPSIWFGGERVEKMLTGHRLRRNTVIYMDYGERELGRRSLAAQFGQAAAALMGKGALVTSRIVPGGEHCEASWEKQVPLFLEVLLYGLEDATAPSGPDV